jgi:hypothetical protein
MFKDLQNVTKAVHNEQGQNKPMNKFMIEEWAPKEADNDNINKQNRKSRKILSLSDESKTDEELEENANTQRDKSIQDQLLSKDLPKDGPVENKQLHRLEQDVLKSEIENMVAGLIVTKVKESKTGSINERSAKDGNSAR